MERRNISKHHRDFFRPRLPSPIEMIVSKYAALDVSGGPIRCAPSSGERFGLKAKQGAQKSKVVYLDRESADLAAEDFEYLSPGSQLHIYQCKRRSGPRGHWHVATSSARPIALRR